MSGIGEWCFMAAELLKSKFRCFNDFNSSEMDAIMEFCADVHFRANEILWTEGLEENYAAFILEGKIGIKKQTEFGGKPVVVGIYTAGSVVGELCLLTDRPRTVSAFALETTRVIALHNNRFEELIQKYPLIGLRLLRHIFLCTSQRLTKSYERITSMF